MDPTSMENSLILTTKIYPPRVTPELMPRSHLLERLERHAQRPLTLISAPAGYGKSILASMWLQNSGRPYGWVSLDEFDNDLVTFLAYLLAAIQSAVPGAPLEQSETLLKLPALPPVQVIARLLLNEINQLNEEFCLALDDIHVIREYAIFDLLAMLLKHPAPVMHLLIIGRSDPPLPIPSLRAYDQINEIRASDLRFTARETAHFFNVALDQDMSDAAAAEWTEKTEGWVVALRLAAISMLSRRKTVWPGITVQGKNQYLQDYLLAEVLGRLSPEKRAWLLKASSLDRFCAPLCEVVCGGLEGEECADGLTGEEFIQWLLQNNYFLVALDDNNEWFRFHHLFRSYLRYFLEQQLSGQEIAAIQLRAGRWLADNGWPEEALKLLLRAGDMNGAVALLDQHRYRLMDAEHWNQLDRWIGLFPEEAILNDPILAIAKAQLPSAYGLEQGQMLTRTHQLLAELPDDSPVAQAVKGELAYFHVLYAVMTGPADGIIEQASEALALLPRRAQNVRGSLIGARAVGLQMRGDYDRGVQFINEEVDAPDWSDNSRARLLIIQSYASFFEGDLKGVGRSASKALKIAKRNQQWKTISEAHYMLGIVHYLRNETKLAESHLSFLVEKRILSDPMAVAQGVCALARLYHAKGKPEKASEAFELVFSHLEEVQNTYSLDVLHAFRIELALDQGDLALARELRRAVGFDMNRVIWYHYTRQLTPIRLLLAEGTAKGLRDALAALELLRQQLRALNRKAQTIDLLALQALAHQAQGDWPAASEKLSTALQISEPGGFIRNYVDLGPAMASLLRSYQQNQGASSYVAKIVSAFAQGRSDSAVAEELTAPPRLTRRELEILQLLATDLSPREIADKTFISVATARTHIRNVYAKLEVNGRFEAVHVAQEQGLL